MRVSRRQRRTSQTRGSSSRQRARRSKKTKREKGRISSRSASACVRARRNFAWHRFGLPRSRATEGRSDRWRHRPIAWRKWDHPRLFSSGVNRERLESPINAQSDSSRVDLIFLIACNVHIFPSTAAPIEQVAVYARVCAALRNTTPHVEMQRQQHFERTEKICRIHAKFLFFLFFFILYWYFAKTRVASMRNSERIL